MISACSVRWVSIGKCLLGGSPSGQFQQPERSCLAALQAFLHQACERNRLRQSASVGSGSAGKRPMVRQSRPGAFGMTRPEMTIGVDALSESRSTNGGSRPRITVVDKASSSAGRSGAMNSLLSSLPTSCSGRKIEPGLERAGWRS